MKNLFPNFVGVASAALAVSLLASCGPKASSTSTDSTKATSATSGASVERGKYLVTTTGCGDCHTPWKMGPQGPEPDMSRMLSGHPAAMKITEPTKVSPPWMAAIDMSFTAFSGPWGVSFTANLTPDSLTGLGAWTQDMFVTALRTGKHMGKGRQILPPMPWPSFKNMNDDDLASIFQYLRTIPAVSNQVPDPIMTMPPGMAGGPSGMQPPHPGALPENPPPPPPAGAQYKEHVKNEAKKK